MDGLLALVLLAPAATLLALAVNGTRGGRGCGMAALGLGGSAGAAIAAGAAVAGSLRLGSPLIVSLGDWIAAPGLRVPFALSLAPLRGTLAAAAAAGCAAAQARELRRKEEPPPLLPVAHTVVLAGLLAVLLADNLLVLLAGWGVLGAGASLGAARAAGARAVPPFVAHRLSDTALFLAVLGIGRRFGFLDLDATALRAADAPGLFGIGLLLVVAAAARAAATAGPLAVPAASAGFVRAAALSAAVFLPVRLGSLIPPGVLAAGAIAVLLALVRHPAAIAALSRRAPALRRLRRVPDLEAAARSSVMATALLLWTFADRWLLAWTLPGGSAFLARAAGDAIRKTSPRSARAQTAALVAAAVALLAVALWGSRS